MVCGLHIFQRFIWKPIQYQLHIIVKREARLDQIYKTDLNELFSYQRKGEKLEEKEKVIEIEIERLRDFKEHGVNMGIKVSNLVMEYKKGVKSLDHVNLNIDHGIYGLLGENGAGKTTLMKILVTLLTPTSGTAEINGLTVEPKNFETIKKQIGYLPQEFGLYPNLTVRESLEYVGIMSGVQFMKSLQSKMFILWTERSATLPERW